MLNLKEIIGSEEPEGNPESGEYAYSRPSTEETRPTACPWCLGPARENGKLTLVGHGTYKRWVKTLKEIRIHVQRFRCIREGCGKTCSVFPHWLLPRFEYTALVILSCLWRFFVDGETAAAVMAEFGFSDLKHGWGTLRRWGRAFLISTTLWGWQGKRLGVRKSTAYSRAQVRIHLERFMRSFSDHVTANTASAIPDIVRLSLANRVFHGTKTWSSLHPPHGKIRAPIPFKTRPGQPTQGAGRNRGPP